MYQYMSSCYYVERSRDGQLRKKTGCCNHDQDFHRSGTCWFVLSVNKKGISKFCECVCSKGNHKPYVELGHLEQQLNDWMMPIKCNRCGKDSLVREGVLHCTNCVDTIQTEKRLLELQSI